MFSCFTTQHKIHLTLCAYNDNITDMEGKLSPFLPTMSKNLLPISSGSIFGFNNGLATKGEIK